MIEFKQMNCVKHLGHVYKTIIRARTKTTLLIFNMLKYMKIIN